MKREAEERRETGRASLGVAAFLGFLLAAAVVAILLDKRDPEPAPLPPSQAIIPNDMLRVANKKIGAEIFKTCVSCHSGGTVQESHKLGPPLGGIVGAPQARFRNYDYSPALLRLRGHYWTTDELDAWLRYPAGYAPGTKMSYAGLLDPQDRWDLIAYLIDLK